MLKPQDFGHLMRRASSLEKIPVLEKTEGRRRSGWQRMRWFDGISDSMDMNLSQLQEIVKDRQAPVRGVAKSQTRLSDWTTTRVLTRIYSLKEQVENREETPSHSWSSYCSENSPSLSCWIQPLPWSRKYISLFFRTPHLPIPTKRQKNKQIKKPFRVLF